jgi:putative nucleotidyltransferase with HDIG domain
MVIEQVEQIARESLADSLSHDNSREPGWLFHHGRRVGRIALHLADALGLPVDRDVVLAAALFHDSGKGSECHHEAGAAIAREKLAGLCSQEELDAICDIIQNHNQRQLTDQFCEAVKIVQDADVLDHVGPIGPWLAFYWSGVHKETFDDHVRFIEGEENAAIEQRMRAGLNYDIARRLFDQRLEFQKRFFAEFKRVYVEGI